MENGFNLFVARITPKAFTARTGPTDNHFYHLKYIQKAKLVMRKYLLPEQGNFYKANLHCHSTISDGRMSPEELKRLYKDAGYSILAITDHNILIDHSDLNDEDFLTVTSVEIDAMDKSRDRKPCFHLNFYSRTPDNTALPCFNPAHVRHSEDIYIQNQKYVGTPDYVRDYYKINDMIEEFGKQGFIACLNHVTWSIQDLDEYRDIKGLFAMEIYNHGCFTEGYDEINSHAYDELLRRGNRIFCFATDDNHNKYPKDSPRFDSLGGYVMVKSPELSYDSVLGALEKGDFYSSTGPSIYEMYVEDNKLYIKTSPVARICVNTYGRKSSIATAKKRGGLITEAVLDIRDNVYFRVVVDDGIGHFAWSNAYWCDTL